ncbi:MAG: MFS transporter, partial [Chloroflexota bacterium]
MKEPVQAVEAPISTRAYVIFGITAMTLMMMAINGFIVAVAFPTIKQQFATNLSLVGWVFTGFFLCSTVVLPLAGKLSDGFGRKRIYMLSVGLFTAASLGCGLAPNVYVLIGFRMLQGVAGGAVQLSATGMVSDVFGSRRQTALGLFSSIYPLGAILGPNVGGVLIEHFSW